MVQAANCGDKADRRETELMKIVDKHCEKRNGCRGCVLNDAEIECEPLGEDLGKAVVLIEQERSKNEQ